MPLSVSISDPCFPPLSVPKSHPFPPPPPQNLPIATRASAQYCPGQGSTTAGSLIARAFLRFQYFRFLSFFLFSFLFPPSFSSSSNHPPSQPVFKSPREIFQGKSTTPPQKNFHPPSPNLPPPLKNAQCHNPVRHNSPPSRTRAYDTGTG